VQIRTKKFIFRRKRPYGAYFCFHITKIRHLRGTSDQWGSLYQAVEALVLHGADPHLICKYYSGHALPNELSVSQILRKLLSEASGAD
jgi:hypothetical protein